MLNNFEAAVTVALDNEINEDTEYAKEWELVQKWLDGHKSIEGVGALEENISALTTAAADVAFKAGFKHALRLLGD